ncbi:MAG TPA: arabinan endo-1,5-alpha-L-arabinosidase [Polyangiaceae bacterium]|nr:arabinan endo-1,5-alpha-L-arabinosidase [Polyangiaceae bacterium]
MMRVVPSCLLSGLLVVGLTSACSSGAPASTSSAAAGAAGAPVEAGGAAFAAGASGVPVAGMAGASASAAGESNTAGGSGGSAGTATAAVGGAGAPGAGQGGALAGGASGGGAVGSGGAALTYPPAASEHRAIGTHDPGMIHVANAYYLFGTGGLLGIRKSTNLATWTNAGTIFSALPGWIKSALGETPADLWAPDISYVNGTYRVYYAGSSFGSNHSVIGLATNTSLDPQNSAYEWLDQGLVLESNRAGTKDDWNAIDPNATQDAAGNWWLVFGSFWSGIKLRRLDTATGKLSTADTTLYALAAHAGGIEAPSIILHNGYYYLFVSFDACCKGVDSTYRTMVGRASAITGPYTDANGKAMLQGNAVQLLAKDGRYIGPGGGTAFRDGELFYYAYHYYDGQMNGASELMLRPINWQNDWPELAAPLWQ